MSISWSAKQVKISELKDFDKNPRKISKEEMSKLVESLQQDGYHQRLVVNQDLTIIGGHQRKKALLKSGFKKTDTIEVLMPDRLLEGDDFDRVNIRDNLGYGAFDFDILKNEFEIDKLIHWGMPEDWLQLDVEAIEAIEAKDGDDDVPEVKAEATAKLGDVWLLGEHRLMCGNSTSLDAVDKLLDGTKIDICFTSPPYNAGTSQRLNNQDGLKDSKYIDYDDSLVADDYLQLLSDFTSNALLCSSIVIVNIQQLAGNKIAFIDYLHMFKNNIIDIAVWDKENVQPAMASNVLNSRFEYIIFMSKESNPKRTIATAKFRGTVDNVYTAKRGEKNAFASEHAATFPVHLPLWAICNFDGSGSGRILDLFGGSGTTLIACEKSKRKCFMMELSPNYCDVIIARWEKLTDQKAELLNA